ncbi:Undecaprenyl-phosphate 4-deoxy-4-formamido-L-arabinose transferase [Candidatus Lokiarchaeum ossiferum]|uniref:Undecaprenyl-phosphate 4-deoxy-4-formamido-L-arabinose transferase n=1 Tax=Candidatus Lokiarchaeum ossiferum TaxID=2951803 RepID=A0ABY6HZZ6_9ARCH|nr:Undecaprenyl-phosphate 4-deoxy-4-formamido-L-arabinose transferase [Candidatus Lokiarchaeum sp. B-35]
MASSESMIINDTLSHYQNNFQSNYGLYKFSQSKKSNRISIILPCFNEAKTVLSVIRKINSLSLENYEIIVVDDASTDQSPELLKNLDNVFIFKHKSNQGYGKTLLDGIFLSTGDIIITLDSDGQHDPRDIPQLCKPVIDGSADFVIGSRYQGKYCYSLPFMNRIGEAFIEIIIKIFFNESIQNNQGGFRVFHRNSLSIFEDIKFHGMAFTTELIMKAKMQKLRIKSLPIHLFGRIEGKSRVKKIPLFMTLLHSFLYYILEYHKKKYPIIKKS